MKLQEKEILAGKLRGRKPIVIGPVASALTTKVLREGENLEEYLNQFGKPYSLLTLDASRPGTFIEPELYDYVAMSLIGERVPPELRPVQM